MIFIVFVLLAWFLCCIILLIRPSSPSPRRSLRPLGGTESRGDTSGVREPRRPRPPYWPPRAATAVPEDIESWETSSSAGSSNPPRQPLRLEDGIA